MKLINAIAGRRHNLISVYQLSNKFGDQILLYKFESHDGRVFKHTDRYQENEWINPSEALDRACVRFENLLNDADFYYYEEHFLDK